MRLTGNGNVALIYNGILFSHGERNAIIKNSGKWIQ